MNVVRDRIDRCLCIRKSGSRVYLHPMEFVCPLNSRLIFGVWCRLDGCGWQRQAAIDLKQDVQRQCFSHGKCENYAHANTNNYCLKMEVNYIQLAFSRAVSNLRNMILHGRPAPVSPFLSESTSARAEKIVIFVVLGCFGITLGSE